MINQFRFQSRHGQVFNLVFAWCLALIALVALVSSITIILASRAGWDERYLETLSGAIVGLGAPVLGLVILRQNPRHRIGWLWLMYGLAVAFFSLAYALKFHANSAPPDGYSNPLFSLLLFSETSYIIRFICLILLMLWFPDGHPPSRRWRFIYWWIAAAFLALILGLFTVQVPWDEVEGFIPSGQLVPNPVGFLPGSLQPLLNTLAPIGFFSILIMTVLAVLAIIIRYRSGSQVVQAQIRWFVVGSGFYAVVFLLTIFFINYLGFLPGVLGNLAIISFYLAIGIAITRYRLYDIDLIIRKALLYTVLTALSALVFFGGVTLLQRLFQALTGQQSPVSIVLSTLVIAALFNPLRRRLQDGIDRRFYRRKYNSEHELEKFAIQARQETDLTKLGTGLVEVVQETMQPSHLNLWIAKQDRNGK